MVGSQTIEIDALHTLENFCDAYDDEESIVVLEAIANSLDVNATKIDITLNEESITFIDNGPGMDLKQFEAYHKISNSSKKKGGSIGFAGVGAKIYLAIWKNTKIHTETYTEKDGPLASDMFVSYRKLKWNRIEENYTRLQSCGTLYRVNLCKNDYKKLKHKLSNIILNMFNPSMMSGLTITINGEKLEPWNPPYVFENKDEIKFKKMSFPITLKIMKEDIPPKHRHIQYHLYGKNITVKKPEWISDVIDPYKNRVYASVDAKACAKHLKINKNSFKSGPQIAEMYKRVEKHIYETLTNNNYIEKHINIIQKNPKTAKYFQNLFTNEEYMWLNPNATGGNIRYNKEKTPKKLNVDEVVSTENVDVTNEIELPIDENIDVFNDINKTNENNKTRHKHGFGIAFIDEDNIPWLGRLDPETNQFQYNIRHPLYHKYNRNKEAINLYVKSLLFSELIKNGCSKKGDEISVEKALNIHTSLMMDAKDLTIVK